MKENVNGSTTTPQLCIYTIPIRIESVNNLQIHVSAENQNGQFKLNELPVIYQSMYLFFSNAYHRRSEYTLLHSYSIKELYRSLKRFFEK